MVFKLNIEYLVQLIAVRSQYRVYNMCYVVNNVKDKNYIRYKGKTKDYKAKTSNLI